MGIPSSSHFRPFFPGLGPLALRPAVSSPDACAEFVRLTALRARLESFAAGLVSPPGAALFAFTGVEDREMTGVESTERASREGEGGSSPCFPETASFSLPVGGDWGWAGNLASSCSSS